jgi:hypothetical protein
MVYLPGTQCAILQDTLHKKYMENERPNSEDLKNLNKNLWIALGHHLAPSNLVIRNYCLQDLYSGKAQHTSEIQKLFYKLARGKDGKLLWAEGYSYWLYTKILLKLCISKFYWTELDSDIDKMEKNFLDTGYLRGGVLYPAPYGDLRDIPLEPHLQGTTPEDYASAAHVTRGRDIYNISPRPMRMNVHTPKKPLCLYVKNGRVYHGESNEPYRYYIGWDNKYQSKWQEILDYIDPRRWF